MLKHCAFMLFAGLLGLPAVAEQGFQVPVEAEVLNGWVKKDGSRVAALHLRLAPGWKTYWRAPGDAGIPPSFNWSGSQNLESVSISWPAPEVFVTNGMRSIGYEDSLVIPLDIKPARKGEAVRLRATMELGVCSDICVPHELNFDSVIDNAETRPTPAIVAALAQQPYSAAEAGVVETTCALQPTADGLQIEARISMPSAGAPEYVVIEPSAGDIWVSEADTRRSGGQVIATSELINVTGGPIALDRSEIRITVLGRKHSVDIHGCKPG